MIRPDRPQARLCGVTVQADPLPETPLELGSDELGRLETTFRAPRWLVDVGRTSWLVVGALIVLVALGWLLGKTATIVDPLALAFIIAAVCAPLVNRLEPHVRRTGAAAIVLLGAVAIAAGVGLLVINGITSQDGKISDIAGKAADRFQSWLDSAGASSSGAKGATDSLQSSVPQVISTFVHGALAGIHGIASIVFMASLAALSLFFLLRDGAKMRAWAESHAGLPLPIAHTITHGVLRSLRGYFRGVTIVAAFNGVVVGLGALILGVPLAGTIAVVTFVTAYVPFIGAFVAGTFAVVLAFGAKGTTTALIMLVIVILANGLLQNVVQPFAMGAALSLNPLIVLVVSIGAGCLFGTLGLVLAAPLVSAAVHITRDISQARAAAIRGSP